MSDVLHDDQTYPAILRLLAEENRRLRVVTEELGATAERLNAELRAARVASTPDATPAATNDKERAESGTPAETAVQAGDVAHARVETAASRRPQH